MNRFQTWETHNLAKFALEAAFTEYTVAHVLPSTMAAAALMLALRVIDGNILSFFI